MVNSRILSDYHILKESLRASQQFQSDCTLSDHNIQKELVQIYMKTLWIATGDIFETIMSLPMAMATKVSLTMYVFQNIDCIILDIGVIDVPFLLSMGMSEQQGFEAAVKSRLSWAYRSIYDKLTVTTLTIISGCFATVLPEVHIVSSSLCVFAYMHLDIGAIDVYILVAYRDSGQQGFEADVKSRPTWAYRNIHGELAVTTLTTIFGCLATVRSEVPIVSSLYALLPLCSLALERMMSAFLLPMGCLASKV